MAPLQGIVRALESKSVKENADALTRMEESLANDPKENIQIANEWIGILQALSSYASRETAACQKKGWDNAPAATVKRLEKVGSVFRGALQKWSKLFDSDAMQSIVRYLLGGMVDKGKGILVPPLGLNYIKSLVCICNYDPHVEHLGDALWIDTVSCAFSIVLDQDLGYSLDKEKTDAMDSDPAPTDDEGYEYNRPVGSKRGRQDSTRPKGRPLRTLSAEKIEGMALLVLLLKSPQAPYLKNWIGQRILDRLFRFFDSYQSWSIAHTNALICVNLVTAELELNATRQSAKFALQMWSHLLSYWSGKEKKDKFVKEELLIAITTFLPLVTMVRTVEGNPEAVRDALDRLFVCLEEDVMNGSFESLQLDSLHLHLRNPSYRRDVYEAITFRSGAKFDHSQALSWAILELQADCAVALQGIFGKIPQPLTPSNNAELFRPTQRKRSRRSPVDSPIQSIIKNAMLTENSVKKRADCSQIILFIIDRHWQDLCEKIQNEIIASMASLIVHEDSLVQTWAFLCIGAILGSDATKSTDVVWLPIWRQAIHRTNVLGVGRAAAHVAHVILAKQRLPLQDTSIDIEAFASNLMVQGPTSPFDSTCAFLCQCLRISDQDMRLYRMSLPDKVIIWLLRNLDVSGMDTRNQLPQHTVADILTLLEEICSLSKPSNIYVSHILPDCAITDTLTERHRTAEHRAFLLKTHLPPFHPPEHNTSKHITTAAQSSFRDMLSGSNDREKKVSDLLITSMDHLLAELTLVDGVSNVTLEKLRRTVDLAVLSLYWESLLVCNGIRDTKVVIEKACDLIARITPSLNPSKMKPEEVALILAGLEPLVSDGDMGRLDDPWDIVSGPGPSSGIKRDILVKLMKNHKSSVKSAALARREIQCRIWRNAHTQNAFKGIMDALEMTVRTLNKPPKSNTGSIAMHDFGSFSANNTASRSRAEGRLKSFCIDLSITFLAIAPMLQSADDGIVHETFLDNANLPRNPRLLQLVMVNPTRQPDEFAVMLPHLLECIRRRQVYVSDEDAELLARSVGAMACRIYLTNGTVKGQYLVMQFLYCTAYLWVGAQSRFPKLLTQVAALHNLVRGWIRKGTMSCWRARDHLICYLHHYLSLDPTESLWSSVRPGKPPIGPEEFPSHILPDLTADSDVRVRFRVGVANSKLLASIDALHLQELFEETCNRLSTYMDMLEHMLTRFIYLANTMVLSSQMRATAYWRLIEVDLAKQTFAPILIEVLTAVASRLGYGLRSLYENHGCQFIDFVIPGQISITRFNERLFGFEDSRALARCTFELIAPEILYNITLADESKESAEWLYSDLCSAAWIDPMRGLADCFCSVLAVIVLSYCHTRIVDGMFPDPDFKLLNAKLQYLNIQINDEETLLSRQQRQLDNIVYKVLRTLSDTDYSPRGNISAALPEEARRVFIRLNQFRQREDFSTHLPNLPRFDINSILSAVDWLSNSTETTWDRAISYHIVHHISTDIRKSSSVNEQLRLLQALIVWFSLSETSFRDDTLLRAVLLTIVPLLAQYDLASSAQGILDWALELYCETPEITESILPGFLSRIAGICYEYSQQDDEVLVNLGIRLMGWIEGRLVSMSANILKGRSSSLVEETLPLWPREPQGNLAMLNLSMMDPSADFLSNPQNESVKFRLARHLSKMDSRFYSANKFCNGDFWHLKHCIPVAEKIQDEDMDGFINALFRYGPYIRSPETAHLLDTVASLFVSQYMVYRELEDQYRKSKRKPKVNSTSTPMPKQPRPERSVTDRLLYLLANEDPAKAHNAYKSLRRVLTVSYPYESDEHLPVVFSEEIAVLRQYPPTAHTPAPRNLSELENLQISVNPDIGVWMRDFSTLLNDVVGSKVGFYAQLKEFIASDAAFAEEMVPILVHILLHDVESDTRAIISGYFSAILANRLPGQCRVVVNTVLYLRNFYYIGATQNPLGHDQWLDVDFHSLSQAAMIIGAYTTALLFLELARERSPTPTDSTNEDILYAIYSRIEEPDGFYGIQSKDIGGFLTKRFYHEGQWDKAFQFHNAEFAAGQPGHTEGLYRSLHSNGYDALSMAVLQSLGPEDKRFSSEASELAYEVAWRTQTWDLPGPQDENATSASMYMSLRAIHRNREQQAVEAELKLAMRNQLSQLSVTGDEDMIAIRSRIQTLVCLGEIKNLRGVLDRKTLLASDLGKVSQAVTDVSLDSEFSVIESTLSTRLSLLKSVSRQEQSRSQSGDDYGSLIKELQKRCLLKLSEAARNADRNQIALNAVIQAQHLEISSSFMVSEEFANVLWSLKEHRPAVDYLKRLTEKVAVDLQDRDSVRQQSLALSRLGKWISEACLEKPTDIHSQFFHKASSLLLIDTDKQDTVDPKMAVVFHQYAVFSVTQYQAVENSPDMVRLRRFEEKIKTMEASNISQESLPEKTRKWYARDKELLTNFYNSQTTFLFQAVEMYSRCLQCSDEFDDSALISLCSLWFAKFDDDHMRDKTSPLFKLFKHALNRIQSRKFVPLARQLCARLSDRDGPSQPLLITLLRKLCSDHPFHSVYQVWAMHEPKRGPENRRKSSRHAQLPQLATARGKAALDILKWCSEQSADGRGKRIQDLEFMCRAFLDWAEYATRKDPNIDVKRRNFEYEVPSHLSIRKIRDFAVPVTTAYTPIDPSLKYDDIVSIRKYSDKFFFVGGNNIPKVHDCFGSDGKSYRQLFKGEGPDDLRQDAVMMQVFELVDLFLKRDKETRRRSLGIRCYQVIPLDSTAGMLEFVQNTTVLQSWLDPAHKKYRPQDIKDPGGEMRTWRQDGNKRTAKYSRDTMRQKFIELKQKLRPVFRHFFTEKHKLPVSWFATRLKYTRSAATTSITGYILGLGDRHISNILIDNNTGELVHIDLGIAFDQGTQLPIPELIPFRLTEDMVDGFGMTGTEGVFRRCAEETLRVLRDQAGIITTILEVFRNDPLHSWTMDAAKVNKVQGDNPPPSEASTSNTRLFPRGTRATTEATEDETEILSFNTLEESADRAIGGVRRKLDKSLSVEYTVNELITTARDPANLAMIFAGWSPFY